MVLNPLSAVSVKKIRQIYNEHKYPEWYPKKRVRVYSNYPKAQDEPFWIKNIPDRIKDFLSRRKNADKRTTDNAKHRKNITEWGYRIRRMRVGKENVILKVVHSISAHRLIKTMSKLVDLHNKAYPKKSNGYIILKPKAYAIGENLLAMSETNYPTVKEVLECTTRPNANTKTVTFLKELAAKSGVNIQTFQKKLEEAHTALETRINHLAYTEKKLAPEFNARRLMRSFFNYENVLFIGMKEGKFVFVPLMDLF